MRTVRTKSIRFYTAFLLLFLALLFTALVSFNNRAAFSMLLERVYRNTQDTVTLYQRQMDHEFSRAETFLYTLITNDADLVTLRYADGGSLQWYRALHRLEKSFKNALPVYGMDGFFCYLPEKDCYLSALHDSNSFLIMRKNLLEAIAREDADFSSWILLQTTEGDYFVKMISDRYSWIGVWIGADTLLNAAAGEQFCFSEPDGTLLPRGKERENGGEPEGTLLARGESGGAGEIRFDPAEPGQAGCTVFWMEGEKQLAVYEPLEHAGLYLVRIMPYSAVSDNGRSLVYVILIVSVSFLLIWVLLFFFLKRGIWQPVTTLTKALRRFRSGDTAVRVPEERQPEEFQMMFRAFNEMVSEIRDLKIDAYEQKLGRKELEIQYLKQQITPHFMINCLNTAYQLTETDHSDLARKMLTNLSRHLRYTLSSGQTVPLSEELSLVENYIELSKIRYPNSLTLGTDCAPECRDAAVVPLLILNFVENSIKHEAVLGTILRIQVEITCAAGQLQIQIWDSGGGYSAEALDVLRALSDRTRGETDREKSGCGTAFLEQSGHIGISNVVLRCRQVYPDALFSFTNRPGAGAQVGIAFPFCRKGEGCESADCG